MKKIAIVSCDKWKNKIEEDLLLQKYLKLNGVDAEIISWEDNICNYDNYAGMILRSVWGYQNKHMEFVSWLFKIKQANILLFNSPDMIMNNIRKNIQFAILTKNDIPIIETKFIYSMEELISKLNAYDKKVIKPIISGSGDKTIMIEGNYSEKIENLKKLYQNVFIENDNGVMLQPYIDSILAGEYSCIYIDGVNTHNMIRFPGVFYEKRRPIFKESVPKEVKLLADKVSKLEEYKEYLYMRVDIVVHNNKPFIMEVELAEPDLLFKYIPDEEIKNQGINELSKKLIRRIR